MNKAILLFGALGACTAGSFGQSLVGYWDLDKDDFRLPPGVEKWKPGAHFAYDESPFEDCVDLKMKTHVGWSTREWGSEGTPDYHCFGKFASSLEDNIKYGNYVSWKVTFSGDAMGEISGFNFDIKNYDGSVDAFKLAWYDGSGNLLGAETGTFGNDWEDKNIDLKGEGLDSNFGSKDMYEFRLFAYDKDGNSSGGTTKKKKKKRASSGDGGRIGLDNIRIHGDGVKCIPEPGTVMLGLLALVPLVLRRRR